jgi:recombination endonuclease VII
MTTPEKLAERREKARLYQAERRKNPEYAARDRENGRLWREAHREKSRASSRAWRKANPEEVKRLNAEWRARHTPEELSERDSEAYRRYRRAHHINKKFGLSTEQYEAMLVAQSNHCKLCPKRDLPNKRLAVDHDRKTGKIRGLLCADCNRGIGLFGDDPQRLRNAADYLETPVI